MATIINNLYLQNGFAEVEVISETYRAVVLLDVESLLTIGKLSLTGSGYVRTRGELLHRLLCGCVKGDGKFVDHINGNILDNRMANLRVVTDSINKRNLHSKSANNTGVIGVQYRENGNYKYYRVSCRDLEGNRITKQFNITVMGDEKAFEDAVKFLNNVSEKHGYL